MISTDSPLSRVGFALAICLTGAGAVAQSGAPQETSFLEPVEMPAPEAYAALKMEGYTAVANDGSGNLTVPLYSLQAEGHALPVVLQYSQKGVRAGEVASYVGLGWNLSIGASLTRVVLGEPDEAQIGFLNTPERTRAIATHLALRDASQNEQGEVNPIDFAAAQNEGYDRGPDAFRYNVGGISGQFRFGEDGESIFQPVTNVRVERADDLSWFEIVAPDGMRYRFGDEGAGSPVDIVSVGEPLYANSGRQKNPTRKVKWNLTSVSDAAGRTVFTVTYDEASFRSEQQFHCTETKSTSFCVFPVDGPSQSCEDIMSGQVEGYRRDESTGSYYQEVYNRTWIPRRITNATTGRFISFANVRERDDVAPITEGSYESPAHLNEVTYFDGHQTRRKALAHTYATSNGDGLTHFDRKLILEEVVEYDFGGAEENTERFEYDMSKRADGTYSTVSRLTPYIDAWGFINDFSTAARPFNRRAPRDRYQVYDLTQSTGNTDYRLERDFKLVDGDIQGLTKAPTLNGSRHGTMRVYEDGRGAKTTYTYGLHQVASFAPDADDVAEGTLVGGVYTCGYPGGCSTCECYQPNETSNSCGPGYDCLATPPDGNQSSKTFTLQPGREYAIRYSLNYWDDDNREVPNRNLRCKNEVDCGGQPDVEGQIDLWYDPRGLNKNWNALLNTQNYDAEVIPLGDLFPEAEGITAPRDITLVANSYFGALWVELVDVTPAAGESFADRMVGGLRIESMEVADLVAGTSAITDVVYGFSPEGGRSSGLLLREPMYGVDHKVVVTAPDGGFSGSCVYESRSVAPDNPITGFQGTHVEYTSVITRQRNVDRGYTVARYPEPRVSVPGRRGPAGDLFLEPFGIIYDPTEGVLTSRSSFGSDGGLVARDSFYYLSLNYPTQEDGLVRMIPVLREFECAATGFNGGKCGTFAGATTQAVGKTSVLFQWRHTLKYVVRTRDGVTSRTDYTYSGDPTLALRTAEETRQDASGISRRTNYKHFALGTSALAVAARAGNRFDLIERVTVSERTGGGALVQSAATTREYARYSATTGELSGAGTGVVRTHRVYDHGILPDIADATLTQTIKAYAPFGAPRRILRYDDPTDVTVTFDLDRATAVDYLNYHTETGYFGSSLRPARTLSADAQEVTYTYDGLGRLTTATERGGARVTHYDHSTYTDHRGDGQIWTEQTVAVTPTGESEVTSLKSRTYYDGYRNPIQTISVDQLDGGGDRITDLGYDNLGRFARRYKPRSRSVSSTSFAPLLSRPVITQTITYLPDPLNRVAKRDMSLYGDMTYTYGASAGELGLVAGGFSATTETDAHGYEITTYTDVFDREIHRKSSAANGFSVRNGYDALGRLDKVWRAWPDQSSAHTIDYGYDAFGRVVSKTIPEEGRTNYVYDKRGRLTAEQTPFAQMRGYATGFRYDAYGDPEFTGHIAALPVDGDADLAFTRAVVTNQSDRTRGAATFGKPLEVRIGHASAIGSLLRTTLLYDGYGRVTKETVLDDALLHGGGSRLSYERDYGYDHLDNVTLNRERFVPADATVERRSRYNRYGY